MGPYLIMVLTLTILNVKTTIKMGQQFQKSASKAYIPRRDLACHLTFGNEVKEKEKTKFVTRIG